MEVFLGGTCNNSEWRDQLIPLLKCEWFNPVVEDWTEEHQQIEIEKRESCDYVLYVITPKMTGVYSIAEVVEDSCKRPDKTIFCVLEIDNDKEFDKAQLKSLGMVKQMIANNGANVFNSLQEIANFLNEEKSFIETYKNS